MTWSANEVMMLAAKAARGAGAPPAQAAQFGRAAVRHLCAGRSESDLAAALDALPVGPIMTLPRFFWHLAEQAIDGCATGALIDQDLAISYAEAQSYLCEITQTTGQPSVKVDLNKPSQRTTLGRIVISGTFRGKMETSAAKLLVPESDASRLSGAGAGLTDND